MNFHPRPPTTTLAPQHVSNDTWLIHQVQEALGAPLRVYINSMVILGPEPVIVDTGTIANRTQWMNDAFSLVDPADVRYVFISHDDADHTGNLDEVMTLCGNATLLASWSLVERHSSAFNFPLERCRWVNDGDHIDLTDRRLVFARPPVYDSPTTRGLFDQRTGIYWAVDAFASPCTQAVESTVDELDAEFWKAGMAMFTHNALSPWLSVVDTERFDAVVRSVRNLGMTTIVGAHSPIITDRSVDAAFEIVSELPRIPAPPVPDQTILEAIVGAMALSH
jgi:flavorubredoxin